MITKISSLVGMLMLPIINHASAQSYSIDWFKIAGGGGTSTGGVYQVSGTIGQQDAGGPLTGGNYSLTGGFWSLVAVVQTTGAPPLRIYLTSTNTVVITWSTSSTGFSLQHTSSLAAPNWQSTTNTVNVVNSENQVIVSHLAGQQFYRLNR